MMNRFFFKSMHFQSAVRFDIDAPETILRHADIIRQKPFLRLLYRDWYESLRSAVPKVVPGAVIELGSGGGFIQEIIPQALTSDIHPTPGISMTLDATVMPFRSQSLKAILMVDVLHHLPRVSDFFSEASRCLTSGGVIAMIEPWNTLFSRLFYRYLHHEPFEPQAAGWHFTPGKPMSSSNQALPWILFSRDRLKFQATFPEWELSLIGLHTPLRYLLSGGVSCRGLVPAFTFDLWRAVEEKLTACMRYLAMFATIKLVRK